MNEAIGQAQRCETAIGQFARTKYVLFEHRLIRKEVRCERDLTNNSSQEREVCVMTIGQER